jgi:hypothetical protein
MPANELAALNHRIIRTFARKQRSAFLLMSAYLAVLTVLIIALLALFMCTTDLKQCLLYGIVILILFEGTVLMKLWFWNQHSKIAIVREIKLLQLSVAELKTRTSPELPSGSASSSPAGSAPTPMPPAGRKSWWPVLGVLWLLAVASLGYFGLLRNDHEPRDFTPYLEKAFPAEDAGQKEWQGTFEVTQPRLRFHPRLTVTGIAAKIWISVAAEGQEPMYTGPVDNESVICFGTAAQGRYVVKARLLEANGNCILRLGGVDKIPGGSSSFERLFPLMFSTALVFTIPLIWLQNRWYRWIDLETQT